MIEIEKISHRFGDHLVLADIDVALTERRVGIVGANGSGKSTLARLLNGLLLPDHGRVRVNGLDTRADPKSVRRRVGFIFQDPDAQIVMPLVEEDIAFGLRNRRLDKAEIDRRVTAILGRYGLEALRYRPCHTLSGGEKQLLALSGILVTEPEWLVFDEPTTQLDLRNRRMIAETIAGLSTPAVVISHDLDLFGGFDRVLVLDSGRLVADDTPAAAIRAYLRLMAG